MFKLIYRLLIVSLILINSSVLLAQEDHDYDPYTPALKYPEAQQPQEISKRERNVHLARIAELPFRPVGHVLGATAEWIERTHLEDKLIWFIDELNSHGLYPKTRTPSEGSLGTIGIGGRIQIDELFKIEDPFAIVNVFGGWTPNKNFDGTTVDFGGDYKIQKPGSSFYQYGLAKFWRSSSESFYGIGQDISRGEWSAYQPEELWLEGKAGYQLNEANEISSAFVYQRMKIGNGNRERIGKIKEHFPTGIPGISGGDLIGIKNEWMRDTRDHATDPRNGGIQKVQFSYFHDVDGSDFHYLKMAGSAAHFIPILSDRRVLALRMSAVKNQKLGGDQIPFYNMARLGGSDVSDGSELLRSYALNRYFDEGLIVTNAEYRYSIYEYGNFGGDAFALFDVGEIFGALGDLGFDELKFSYGGGLNLKFRRKTFLSFVIARGSEGVRAATHTKISF